MDRADEQIVWEPHLRPPAVPSDDELRAQERARRRAWQAARFEQLREQLR
jgi:hypothetical protein